MDLFDEQCIDLWGKWEIETQLVDTYDYISLTILKKILILLLPIYINLKGKVGRKKGKGVKR